jgi:hypothetical protein
MNDLFSKAGCSLEASGASSFTDLRVDPWIASSILQKAIRRGDARTAERAAVRLHRLRGKGVWRRFLIIAYEDVGIGSIEALSRSTRLCVDPAIRRRIGGDEDAIRFIVRLLAAAPKDRSADHLTGAAFSHPACEPSRTAIAQQSLSQRLQLVGDADATLLARAMAAWRSSGLAWGEARPIERGDPNGLMSAFTALGAPNDLVLATSDAALKTGEPIVLMAPLIWVAANRGAEPTSVQCAVPAAPIVDGAPLYAFDKHTSIGKTAIHRWAHDCMPLRSVLDAFVEEPKKRSVACMAAFYADAAPVALRFDWDGSKELEALGVEADMLRAGSPLSGIAPILSVARDNLDHLNALRRKSFSRLRLSK